MPGPDFVSLPELIFLETENLKIFVPVFGRKRGRDSNPLCASFSVAEPSAGFLWIVHLVNQPNWLPPKITLRKLQRRDLNPRYSGYGPDEMTLLLHAAEGWIALDWWKRQMEMERMIFDTLWETGRKGGVEDREKYEGEFEWRNRGKAPGGFYEKKYSSKPNLDEKLWDWVAPVMWLLILVPLFLKLVVLFFCFVCLMLKH